MSNKILCAAVLALIFAFTAHADPQYQYFNMKKSWQIWKGDLKTCNSRVKKESDESKAKDLQRIRLDVCSRAYQDDPFSSDPTTHEARSKDDLANDVSGDFHDMYVSCVQPNYTEACTDLENEKTAIESESGETPLHTRFKLPAPPKNHDLVDTLYLEKNYKADPSCEARMIVECLNVMTHRRALAISKSAGRDTHYQLTPDFETNDSPSYQFPSGSAKAAYVSHFSNTDFSAPPASQNVPAH